MPLQGDARRAYENAAREKNSAAWLAALKDYNISMQLPEDNMKIGGVKVTKAMMNTAYLAFPTQTDNKTMGLFATRKCPRPAPPAGLLLASC